MSQYQIKHNAEDQEFTTEVDGHSGELAYSLPMDDVIDFSHTYVDEDIRGQGVADELIKTGLKYAEENNLKVVATCPAVSAYIRRHHEFQKLLK